MRRLSILGFLLAAAPAFAQAPSFTAAVDRNRITLDDTLAYEATLTVQDGRPEGYQPPDFRGFRVIAQQPSQSTQMRLSPQGSSVQTVLTWHYELQPLQKGTIAIAPARVRIGGREIATSRISVMVGERIAPPPALGPQSTALPRSFIRAVVDKQRVFAGEQVTAGWYLYVTDPPDKYQTTHVPSTDGFWSEELPVPTIRNGLALTEETYAGHTWRTAPLFRRALFPLKAGTLTIGSLDAETARLDLFGMSARTARLRSDPVTVEVLPLPAADQPAGFDPAAVGRYTLVARVDRPTVTVGEPVTLTLEIRGRGNLRNVRPPKPPAIDGWKRYEPRSRDSLEPDADGVVMGTKTVEILLVAERPGQATIPPLALPYFDPEARSYETASSQPIVIEAKPGGGPAAPAGPAGVAAAGSAAAVDNVIPVEIRPIRTSSLRRDVGATIYRTRWFAGLLAAPPLAFGLVVAAGSLRRQFAADTAGARRRRARRQARRRLLSAEEHSASGHVEPFLVEIDRVLREALAARLGRSVAGLRLDELRALLAERGFIPDLADRVVVEIEACDRARFAPGAVEAGAMAATLDRAGDLILALERAKLS